MTQPFQLRRGEVEDLDAINGVITRAIGTWKVADRVKRLALPVYHYTWEDFAHLEFLLARVDDRIAAVAAWEPATPDEAPEGCDGLLLHGLFVDPDVDVRGLGTTLLHACVDTARERGLDGVLVRATRDSASFFEHRGLTKLPVKHAERDHALRYWMPT